MAENVVGIDIVARLDAFRSELAKIPDIGAAEAKTLAAALSKEIKAAETASRKAAKASEDVKRAQQAAAKAAEEAAKSADRLKDASGDTASAVGKLAGVLDLVAPGAGAAATTLVDFADAGEVAAQVGSALGLSAGGVLTVLGPLVLALGAVGYAVYESSERQREGAERARDYALALDEIREAARKAGASTEDLKVREDLLNGAITKEDAEAMRAQAAAAQTYADAIGKVESALQEQADRLAAVKATSKDRGITDLLFGAGSAEIEDETRVLKTRMSELTGSLASLRQAQADYGERLAGVTTGERTQAEAQKGSEKATRDHERAVRELEKAQADAERASMAESAAALKAAEAAVQARQQAAAKLSALRQAAAAEVAATYGTETDRVQAAHDERVRAATEAARSALRVETLTADEREAIAQELTATLAALEEARGVAITQASLQAIEAAEREAEARRRAQDQAQSQTAQAISQASSGLEGIATLIGGPVAGAVAGLVLNLDDSVARIREQLLSIPDILRQAPGLLTDLVITIAEEVLPAMVDAIPDVVRELALSLTSPEFLKAVADLALFAARVMFDPSMAWQLGLAAAQGLLEAFKVGFEALVDGTLTKNLVKILDDTLIEFFYSLGDFFRDLVKEIVTLGKANTSLDAQDGGQSSAVSAAEAATAMIVHDSPGVMRSGPHGQTYRTAPGDYTASARTFAGLVNQVMPLAATPGPAPVLSLADSGVLVERQVRRVLRARPARDEIKRGSRTGRR